MQLTRTRADRIVRDADPWLRRLGLPYYTLSILLEMRVGDEVVLFDYDGPPIVPGATVRGRGVARIERCRDGQWRYDALWMLGIGKLYQRGTIWTFGAFKVQKFRRLSWEVKDAEAMRVFEHVLRLSSRLARMARARGDCVSMQALKPYPYRDLDAVASDVPLLETLAPMPKAQCASPLMGAPL